MNPIPRACLRALIPSLLAGALPAGAANPPDTAYAEKSSIVGTGQVVHLYGLPTTDVNGAFKYFDVTLTLTVNDNGVPTQATLEAVKSPGAKTNQFAVGTYHSSDGGSDCALQTSAFSGRFEVDFHCSGFGNSSQFVWWTGPIKGNPIESELRAAGLDKLPDNDQYAWGHMLSRNNGVNWWGCMVPFHLVAAREVGGTITLTDYGNDTVIDCVGTLFKLP